MRRPGCFLNRSQRFVVLFYLSWVLLAPFSALAMLEPAPDLSLAILGWFLILGLVAIRGRRTHRVL